MFLRAGLPLFLLEQFIELRRVGWNSLSFHPVKSQRPPGAALGTPEGAAEEGQEDPVPPLREA